MQIENRTVVITGGGSGIGEALAERCVAGGARHVVVADLSAQRAEAVAERLGDRVRGVGIDVADEAAIKALVDDVLATAGPIDLFVSNAGYGKRGGVELSNEDFERMWQVHTMAHVYAARAVLPSMIERGEGYLLNTASAAGLLTQMDSVIYAVTKHAAVSLAEWLSINHHHQGIRVSVLCPQAVATNILASFDDERAARGSGGQASGDGVLDPLVVADACLDAVANERFLVLPHPEVLTYFQRKATDYDRWLGGMRRYANRLWGDSEAGLPGDWLVR